MHVDFSLMLRSWMAFSSVQRMVLTPSERAEISRQMEIYRMSGGTFGYDMAVQDRTTRMPSTICLKLSNFDLLDS